MTRSPTVSDPAAMPCAVITIEAASAPEKITFCPKFSSDSEYCVCVPAACEVRAYAHARAAGRSGACVARCVGHGQDGVRLFCMSLSLRHSSGL